MFHTTYTSLIKLHCAVQFYHCFKQYLFLLHPIHYVTKNDKILIKYYKFYTNDYNCLAFQISGGISIGGAWG
jgi:hypothetical protein